MQTGDSQRQPEPRSSGPLGTRVLVLGLGVFLLGIAAALYFHWPALTNYGMFKDDIVQGPHWAAYHHSSFQPDDPVLRYASFNESPLQNAIYWVGTWFMDFIALGKGLAVISYGALSLLFFLVGRAMHGTRFGLLLALFITLLPDQWDYSAGFFSKFWMIPLLLICLFLLQTERFRGLIGLLPFAALAYPTAAVLIGMTCTVYWIHETITRRKGARRLFRCLAIGSAIAVALLMVKYISPPDFIGPMRSGVELRAMPELAKTGYPSHYIPIPPLYRELFDDLSHPFMLFAAAFYFLVLGRKRVGWDRAWTALFVASAIGYLLADYFFMRLYIPNRFMRYSMALLLALWNARNWDLILAQTRRRPARLALLAALLAAVGYFSIASFDSGRGWTDRRRMTAAAQFIRRDLPEGILFAGSPKRLDDVMIQGQRSVLTPYKLVHPWFITYYDGIRERTQATLRAHFAAGPEPLNELHRRYGVTHFLVEKRLFVRARENRRLFVDPYNEEIYEELGRRRGFYLANAPAELFLWQDEHYAVLELPIPEDDPRR